MTDDNDTIPVYLMPVAAILGMYIVVGGLRALYLIYINVTYDPLDRKQPAPLITIGSSPFNALCFTLVVAIIGYGSIVGKINKAMIESEYAHFDPYDILGVSESTPKSDITQAYRQLVKVHHPDKGGSESIFLKIQQAYEALTDELGIANYAKYGHPDGPISAPSFQLALPNWLLFPEGKIAAVMILLYMLMMVGIGIFTVRTLTGKDNAAKKSADLDTNSVGLDDLAYMGKLLHPNSTHFDVLVAIASAPENLQWSTTLYEKIEKMREEAMEEKKKQSKTLKKESVSFDDALNDDAGWDDEENEEDESAKQAALLAKKAEEDRQRDLQQLKKATGQVKEVMEGIDDGVLGQQWVENTLSSKDNWPPKDLSILKDVDLTYNGKNVSPMDHPGLRRLLCMTMGRINSRMLNTHPELCK